MKRLGEGSTMRHKVSIVEHCAVTGVALNMYPPSN